MKQILLVIFVFLIGCQLNAQSKKLRDKEDMVGFSDKFMKTFSELKYNEAVAQLKQFWPVDPADLDTLLVTIQGQMEYVNERFGSVLGYEFVSDKQVKNSLYQRIYLLKLEGTYLKFRLLFYNNGTGWSINKFHYNDDETELFN